MLRILQAYKAVCLLFCIYVFALLGLSKQSEAQVLPLEQSNTLTSEWFVYDSKSGELVPYVAVEHTSQRALHQWLSIVPSQPFPIGFSAPKGLSIFLNNRLVFKADSTASFKLDLAERAKGLKPVDGKVLLSVWHPRQQPNINSFYNDVQSIASNAKTVQRPLTMRVREYVNQNAFILVLLLIGLVYGWLKVNYPSDFKALYDIGFGGRSNRLDEGFLSKPLNSWSSILFVFSFSLSLALLIAAIHTNVQYIQLFNRLFPVSEADITTKIAVYTLAIFFFIVFKYFFLKIMAFIFGLGDVVLLQYREFVKTLLFLGIFLPFVMLLYLSMNSYIPEIILMVSNILVSLLLLLAVLRVFVIVNKKATVLNLHLFSYLCATEVIPLAIVLKLIVFNF